MTISKLHLTWKEYLLCLLADTPDMRTSEVFFLVRAELGSKSIDRRNLNKWLGILAKDEVATYEEVPPRHKGARPEKVWRSLWPDVQALLTEDDL